MVHSVTAPLALVKLAPLLAEHFTVFAYDRRGRGESGDTQPYEVQKEIEDLEALINEAGGSADVFAMSSGAVLALKAVSSGLNIKKLALYEPPFVVGHQQNAPPADHQQQLKQLIANHQEGAAVKFFLKKIMGVPAFVTLIMPLTPNWAKMKSMAKSLQYDSAVMGNFSLPVAQLKSIMNPTIVMGGEKSPELLRASVKAVAETMPNAKLSVMVGQNHNVNVDLLAPLIIDFF
jgi:pimeloyl-ACP methyl ester carboxylesterase